LIIHRAFKDIKPIVKIYEKIPRISSFLSWMSTQYFIFMAWLVFRLEDTTLLILALKTYIGVGGHWDLNEMNEALPEIRFLTLALHSFS
jgi:D-alanyl-lipoteichoic acid acyltransferase DltB (MBOAT superfamily)